MNKIYSPISGYDINFDEVKSNLLRIYPESEDYGNILIIRREDCLSTFHVLKNGTIQIIENDCEYKKDIKNKILEEIISVFTDQAEEMKYNSCRPVFQQRD